MENQTVTISKEAFREKVAKVTEKIMDRFSDNPKAGMVVMLSNMSFAVDLMDEIFKEESDVRC